MSEFLKNGGVQGANAGLATAEGIVLAAAQAGTTLPVQVVRPTAGAEVQMPVAPGTLYVVDFDPAAAEVALEGNDFTLTFGDGGKLVFSDLVGASAQGNDPMFLFGSAEVSSSLLIRQALTLAGDTSLQVAAGVQGNVLSGGNSVYEDSAGDTISLLSRQNVLDGTALESSVPQDLVDDDLLLTSDGTPGVGPLSGFAYSVAGDTLGSDGGEKGSFLYKIDLLTGAVTQVGQVSDKRIDVEALALNPSDGMLYGAARTNPGGFVKIDPATAEATFFSEDKGRWQKVEGMSFDSEGNLYAVTDDDTPFGEQPVLYRVDLSPGNEGDLTRIGRLDIIGFKAEGLASDPITGKLYVVAGIDHSETMIYEVDPTDASIISFHSVVDADGNSIPDLEGMSFDSSGVLWAFQSQGGGIYMVDPDTGVATFVSDSLGADELTDDFESLAIDITGAPIPQPQFDGAPKAQAGSITYDESAGEATEDELTELPEAVRTALAAAFVANPMFAGELPEVLGQAAYDVYYAVEGGDPGADELAGGEVRFVAYSGAASGVTTGGAANEPVLLFSDAENPNIVWGKTAAGGVVFALHLDSSDAALGAGESAATFVQFQQINHPDAADPDDAVTLLLSYVVEDGDGDVSEPAEIQVTVEDDGPGAAFKAGTISELVLGDGDPSNDTINKVLPIDSGRDAPGEIVEVEFLHAQDGEDLAPLELKTAEGDTVGFGPAVVVEEGGRSYLVLTGTAASGDTEIEVMTLRIDQASGEFWYTLQHGLEHPDTGAEDLDDPLDLIFRYTYSDADGDSVTARMRITVLDEETGSVVQAQAQPAGGTPGDDVLTADGDPIFPEGGSDTIHDASNTNNTLVYLFDDAVPGETDLLVGFDVGKGYNPKDSILGDIIDISDILDGAGYDPNAHAIEDFVRVLSNDSGDSVIGVSLSGDGANFVDIAQLDSRDVTLDELLKHDNLVTV